MKEKKTFQLDKTINNLKCYKKNIKKNYETM